MRVPTVHGLIDRRILINYRVDPAALRCPWLPRPFRPKLIGGYGMAGVCLIRLKQVRPWFLPGALGIGSENAAHRIAVEWDEGGELREGVFVARRDTSSRFNSLVGGRLFPGVHHHARFRVAEHDDCYRVTLDSDDDETHLAIEAREATPCRAGPCLGRWMRCRASLTRGSLGYSPAAEAGHFDGLELQTFGWQATPLAVEEVRSSYFQDRRLFPAESVAFDSALLMRNIEHAWHARPSLRCLDPIGAAPATAGSGGDGRSDTSFQNHRQASLASPPWRLCQRSPDAGQPAPLRLAENAWIASRKSACYPDLILNRAV